MIRLTKYNPHLAQRAFHYYADEVYRYLALISGIRAGKTYGGARQALKESWNSKKDGVYGIVAPTYNMLKRTTWAEFKKASRSLIAKCNETDKIIELTNGRMVHGHSADRPDKIRNETFCGAWVDEARECPDFALLWDILLGRVLSTKGKIFITTSPNSYDDIHEIFIERGEKDYGVIQFPTYANTYLDSADIDSLADKYDERFAAQELKGEFVIFQGAVYYTFNRKKNAGDVAFKVAQYNPDLPLDLCCDFNVDPMAWVVTQKGIHGESGLAEIRVIDEFFVKNTNTMDVCEMFKDRYPNHDAGLYLYGDATGKARHSSSNKTNWKIIQNELAAYAPIMRVPTRNPAERDRINAVNGVTCNSRGVRRLQVNPKCKKTIRDLEQVAFKEGTSQIDKKRSLELTHMSDALGYRIEQEFSLNKGRIEGLALAGA